MAREEFDYEKQDRYTVRLLGESLQTGTLRILAFGGIASLLVGTVAWLLT